jgi:hypothetical protein
MDAIKGLRYCFLITGKLLQSFRRDGPRDPDVIAGQQFGCEFLERFPLARAGNALLDNTAADIGGDQSSFRIPDSTAQRDI